MRPQLTFLPDPDVPSRGRFMVYAVDGGEEAAASTAAAWGLRAAPAGSPLLVVPVVGEDGAVAACLRSVPAVGVPVADALPALLALRRDALLPDSAWVWALAARVAVHLVAAQRLLPALALVRAGAGDAPRVVGRWRTAARDDPAGAEAVAVLAAALPRAGHAVPLGEQAAWPPGPLLHAFLDAVGDVLARTAPSTEGPRRPRARLLPWTARWAEALADRDDPAVPLRDEAEDLVAAVEGWLSAADAAGGAAELELVPPDDEGRPWVLRFAVRDEEGVRHEADEVWARGDAALGEVLLAGLARAARLHPPLERALDESAPAAIELDLEEALELLVDGVPLLRGAGLVVDVPGSLAGTLLRGRLRVGDGGDVAAPMAIAGGDDGAARAAAEVGYRWELVDGDDVVADEDVAALLRAEAPLVRWRGGWVLLDEELRAAAARHGATGSLGLGEAVALGLQEATWEGFDGVERPVDVVASGDVAAFLERLRSAADLPDVPAVPDGFAGELRDYQRRGVAWLRGMADLGLGGVLADDMGLGKTIELLAHAVALPRTGAVLVVTPTSVVGNWVREAQRFVPGLPVTRHHGADRARVPPDITGLVVTSYGTLRRDAEELAEVPWTLIALDEAQQVKNPETAAARAVRRLRADQVVALTGTPLENRLAELWALLDATNPGLLGGRAAFRRRFVAPVERGADPEATRRLRRLVAPFVLRRTKADPAIAADLPAKIERTLVCPLTPEQVDLYERAVATALDELRDAEGMARRGRVLALLTSLKQITNHPAHYLREGPERLVGRSGKLEVAREVLQEVASAGDRALVFTQYTAMGDLLVAQIGQDLGTAVPFLHGGVSGPARDRMVAAFQSDDDASPVLVVSTRAGGLGLNLTAATHVLHYDRWWNPAVEDQATDRAHRIGQTRTVEVHKLVTAGTVEERIAELLQRKRALADAVITAGETWITELDDAALADLVRLSADAPVEEWTDEAEGLVVGR